MNHVRADIEGSREIRALALTSVRALYRKNSEGNYYPAMKFGKRAEREEDVGEWRVRVLYSLV